MTSSNRADAGLLVVAAGEGRRLGTGVHKALVPLAGAPLVEHTLRRLLAVDGLDPVVLVGHPADRAELDALVGKLPGAVQLVDGGARRQDSVAAGLAALDAECEIVLVHDAARPFVPVERLDDLIAAARLQGCALLAVPVADTLKSVREAGDVSGTVARADLWAAQTPQAFRRSDLADLLAAADVEGRTVTDEAALFETAGRAVRIVEGSRVNFKVTTPEDLELARALLDRETRDTPRP